MQIVIPMSGQGRRFKVAGYKTPKYMLDCGNGLSVIENLVKTFPSDSQFLFILNTIDFADELIVHKINI